MPIFGSKFSPKKSRVRKSILTLNTDQVEELVLDNRKIKLQLGDQELHFENGQWIPASGSSGNTYKSNQKLKQKLQQIEEENNMLKLKIEILLNMLTQTTAEAHVQLREINKLKKQET